MSWIYIFAIVIPAVKAVLLFAIWRRPRWLYLVFALSFVFCFLFFLALTLGTYFNLGFLSHMSSTVEPQPLFFIAAFNIFSASVFAYLAFLREGLFHISAVKLYIPLQVLFSWALLFPNWPNLPLALIVSSLVLFFALLWWGHLVGHRFWVYFLTSGAVVGLLVWLILEMFIPKGVGYAGVVGVGGGVPAGHSSISICSATGCPGCGCSTSQRNSTCRCAALGVTLA